MTVLTKQGVSAAALRGLIQRELPDLIAIRRDLHAHPEVGYEEQRTSQVVQRELNKVGVHYKAGLAGGTGVMAHLPAGGADSSPGSHNSKAPAAIGLRADMDALPIEETSGLPHASTIAGTMHACGHDGHTTILIGAARVLAAIARQAEHGGLPRPVSLIFQPAEEGGAGGQKMVQEGCMDGRIIGPPIQNMFGLHGWPRLPLGVVGTRPGPLLAASDRFDILVKGVGAHAAWPHASRDPIVAAAAIVSALQTIVSRNLNPLDAMVVSITMLRGGTAYNVIPQQARVSGTVRTLTPQALELAQRRLHEISASVARGYGCEASCEYRLGYPVTQNDPGAVEIFNATATAALGEQRVVNIPQPVMGGEDFSFYCQVAPSCFFVLGLIPQGKTAMPDLHQSDFDFNDDAIATGVELFCRLALRPPRDA